MVAGPSRERFSMNPQRLINALFISSLCIAFAAGGCSGDDGSDGDGDGGMGGRTSSGPTTSGDGDTTDPDTSGDGDSGDPEPIYPVFTGPGLQILIDDVSVDDEGVCAVEFRLTDDGGRALDREGVLTEGAIAPGFVLSWLKENRDGESLQYVAYTTRVQEVDGFDPETQSSTDFGGTYEMISLGRYKYTFATKIDINEERSHLTHTLGVYGRRAFGDKNYVDNELYSWVPDGSDVETVHDVVTDESCNSCHSRLEFHGGQRRGVGMCNLCHTEENSIDPESGNTVDFQVMIHKIHMGENLPSVQAGEPYQIVGYMGHVADYSEIIYPWDMRDCSKCHTGSQGERWIDRPSQKPCASCHDRTYFGAGEPPEGWTKHSGGPRDDSECIVCHAGDSLEPIEQSHYTRFNDPSAPVVEAEILSISGTSPGSTPTIEFVVSVDGAPLDLIANPLDRIRMNIWGPTSDVSYRVNEIISEAPVCSDPVVPPCLAESTDGFTYHAATAIPAGANGTYFVGMDGRYALDGVNYPFENPILEFAVTGETMSRRQVVSLERCNSCHEHLAPHGGNYNQIEYCLNCHNPGATGGAEDVTPGQSTVAPSINLKDLIHRLHSTTHYPAPVNDCAQCHDDDTIALPLADDALPSTSILVECPSTQADCLGMGGASNVPLETTMLTPAQSAACTSCHNSTSARVHAETNSSMSGEACATCHGPNRGLDVGVVHELDP